MKTSEKAKELVTRFSKIENRLTYIDTKGSKMCALICVDEIIKETKRISLGALFLIPLTEWWQEVKEEIAKM